MSYQNSPSSIAEEETHITPPSRHHRSSQWRVARVAKMLLLPLVIGGASSTHDVTSRRRVSNNKHSKKTTKPLATTPPATIPPNTGLVVPSLGAGGLVVPSVTEPPTEGFVVPSLGYVASDDEPACEPATSTFQGTSTTTSYIMLSGEGDQFETCFELKYGNNDVKYCWSKSYKSAYYATYYQCIPKGDGWKALDITSPKWSGCGPPCQDMYHQAYFS